MSDALRQAAQAVFDALDAMGDASDGDVSPYIWGKVRAQARLDALRAALSAPPAVQPGMAPEWIDAVMDQAQVFASAWSLVGGRFDFGRGLEEAEIAKQELRAMLAALAQPPAPTAQLCHCKDRPADQCPGEWEPGCDLGANPAHVRVSQPVQQPTAAPASPHIRAMANAVLRQIGEPFPREEVDLDAVGLLCRVVAGGYVEGSQAAPAERQPLTVPALTEAQMRECAWGYVPDSSNLGAYVTGIIQATQLACAAAWGVKLATAKGGKL